MRELQPLLDEGWMPVSGPDPDCWVIREEQRHRWTRWSGFAWLVVLILSLFLLGLPLLAGLENEEFLIPISFDVRLQRSKLA
jgi:hypothetical protein